MTTKDNGGPAFPAPVDVKTDMSLRDVTSGMSLRDWFAGQAMQGLLANKGDPRDYLTQAARDAYEIADAMLVERAKS